MNKATNILFLIFIWWSGLLLASSEKGDLVDASKPKKMTMVFTRPKSQPYGKWMYLVFNEAFNRMGIELDYKYYPPKRCSFLANAGMVDGELGRTYSYNQAHPNLIRTEEPIASINWVAYTLNPTIQINGWEDLEGTSLNVEYRSGLEEARYRLSALVSKENLSAVKSDTQGLYKLAAGRTDLYVGIKEAVTQYLINDEFADSKIRIAGTLEEETLHAFLHIKHKSIAPELSAVLKQMKNEGLLTKYRAAVKS